MEIETLADYEREQKQEKSKQKKSIFAVKQKMRQFKRLQRRFRHTNDMKTLRELAALDDEIAKANIKWVRTYSLFT